MILTNHRECSRVAVADARDVVRESAHGWWLPVRDKHNQGHGQEALERATRRATA
jgi:RimJ/RimL family protein N-acetyltransferase